MLSSFAISANALCSDNVVPKPAKRPTAAELRAEAAKLAVRIPSSADGVGPNLVACGGEMHGIGRDLLLCVAARIIDGLLTAREDGQQEDFSLRLFFADGFDDAGDALGNAFRRIAAGVIGADHEHAAFGLMPLSSPF